MNSIIKSALDILAPTNVGQTPKHTPLLPKSQRTVVNGVDIDRLHWVIANRPLVPRGAGKTFARIQEFIGMIELGYTEFSLLITNYRDCQYLNPMIFEQLRRRGITFTYKSDQKRILGPIFKAVYMTDRDMTQMCRGWRPEIIYLRHWD